MSKEQDLAPEPAEVLSVKGSERVSFDRLIHEKYQYACVNCGSGHKLRVKLVVPLEAGGKKIESNAVLVCRACEMATEASSSLVGSEGERRPINFWVSRQLHARMTNGMSSSRGIRSISQLIRYLMVSYVDNTERFDDLDRFQNLKTNDVKINAWVPKDQYELFKSAVNARGLTVTDAVIGLIQLFDAEVTEPKLSHE